MTTTNPTDAQMKLADFKAEWHKDMSGREIEALAGRMRANPEIKAPCQGYPGGIPWETHMRAYEVYCAKYRGQVALIDLFGRGCRGGFGVKELDAFIPGWRDELSLIATLNARIQATEARAQGLVEAERERCLEIAKNELIKCKKRTWGWYICWRIHEAIRSQHSQHGGERER